MARQRGVELPPARLITILVLLATLVFGLGYLLHLPLLQVYWGIYARLRPMLSEQDLVQAGKPLPEAYTLDMSGLPEPNHNTPLVDAGRAGGSSSWDDDDDNAFSSRPAQQRGGGAGGQSAPDADEQWEEEQAALAAAKKRAQQLKDKAAQEASWQPGGSLLDVATATTPKPRRRKGRAGGGDGLSATDADDEWEAEQAALEAAKKRAQRQRAKAAAEVEGEEDTEGGGEEGEESQEGGAPGAERALARGSASSGGAAGRMAARDGADDGESREGQAEASLHSRQQGDAASSSGGGTNAGGGVAQREGAAEGAREPVREAPRDTGVSGAAAAAAGGDEDAAAGLTEKWREQRLARARGKAAGQTVGAAPGADPDGGGAAGMAAEGAAGAAGGGGGRGADRSAAGGGRGGGGSGSKGPEGKSRDELLPLDKLQKLEDRGAALSPLAQKHQLTKEMVAAVAEQNTVLVTWANYHYRDFVMNWVEHVNATGCRAFLVGAMDDQLLEALLAAGVPAFAMSSGLTTKDFGWGTPTFFKMGREKINLIFTFTKMGYDILVSDVDTVWLRNPIPYVKRYPEADILTSSDHLTPTSTGMGLERWPEAGSAANIGVMLFRPSAHEFAKEWVSVLDADDKYWDQNAFNDLFRRGSRPLPDRADNLFLGYDGKLKVGVLPISLFCSGHTYYIQRLSDRLGLDPPFVVHGTFQFSGTPGKRNRMRERLIWNDPPEYFDHPVGFITYEPDIPKELLSAAKNVKRDFTLEATLPHFNLVNHQLLQMRSQFALAQVLGRAAILPRLWCGMDRWWAPHDGTIPGGGIDLPFQCPSDHVLDLETMVKDWEVMQFREYSFLDNSRATKLVDSVLTVQICQDSEAARCADGSGPARVEGGRVRLRPRLTAAQYRAALGEVAKGYKVLRFEGRMQHAFGGFGDRGREEEFQRRLKVWLSIWCCVDEHPGHIWYDFFWDKVPHTDRHNREQRGPWKPMCGP